MAILVRGGNVHDNGNFATTPTHGPPMKLPARNPLSANKLLHSKWTATAPVDKEKHFMVIKVVEPAYAGRTGDAGGTAGRALAAHRDLAMARAAGRHRVAPGLGLIRRR